MYAGGVDHDVIAGVLDWVEREALQPNGDFYFPEEPPEYKDTQRVYRPLTFGKVAAWIGHPVIRRPRVIDRIMQYQHASGGVFNYIGDDPAHLEPQRDAGHAQHHVLRPVDAGAGLARAGAGGGPLGVGMGGKRIAAPWRTACFIAT